MPRPLLAHGKEAMVEFGGKTYTSSPLVKEKKSLLSGGFSREREEDNDGENI